MPSPPLTLGLLTPRGRYLDSTFCAQFHKLKTQFSSLSPDEIAWVGRGILLAIWLIAFFVMTFQVRELHTAPQYHHTSPHLTTSHHTSPHLTTSHHTSPFQICHIIGASKDHRSGISSKCHAMIDRVHRMSMLGISIRLILLVAPPAFYIHIFTPCWDCFDFEAAATHEVGRLPHETPIRHA